ncbi:transmembrane protein 208-like [Artemia franciscana]|uniref:transmembrane protein 208-like n=1 Tax=Artemia franciscana TaxID=6661 RepID=UPI0032DA88CC
MAVQKGKQATKGQKQIAEENVDNLTHYRNIILGTNVVFFVVHSIFYPRISYGDISLFGMVTAIYICCFQFMRYIARPTFGEKGQLFDAGVDLNMHSGVAEHVKDILIWTCFCQGLSLISSYFWFLLLLIPGRFGWMAWRSIISPWLFQQVPVEEVSEKKQRKLERKMMRK